MILNIMSDLFTIGILIGFVWLGIELLDVTEVIWVNRIRERG